MKQASLEGCERDVYLKTVLNEPFVLYLEPYGRELKIGLSIEPSVGLCAVAIALGDADDSFPTPYYLNCLEDVPALTSMLITKDNEGYTVYFCLSHRDQIVTLQGEARGKLHLHAKSGTSFEANVKRPALVAFRGLNLHQTIERVIAYSLNLTHGMGKLVFAKGQVSSWMQTLGWESGACLGMAVAHDSILEKVENMRSFGYQPGFVLIDEGWQDVSGQALKSFEADLKRFPKGLKGLVEDLNALGVQYVGVWHGMMGYRGGVELKLARKYEFPPDAQGRYFLGYDIGHTFEFFHDYYSYLRDQGISFTKVGDQASPLRFCRTGMDVTSLHRNLQIAIQAASSIHFNGVQFNTDCLRNENLYYWTTSTIARVAKDIDLQSPGNVLKSIRNNLMNSMWMQYLMQPDFDAWKTTDNNGESLAIFHALSGSINIVSDISGDHQRNYIKKMILPCGKVLKADRPLSLCQDSFFINPLEEREIYKAFTHKNNSGILAVFNIIESHRSLHGEISPSEVEGLKGEMFAVLSYHNGFLGLYNKKEFFKISLKPHQSDVFTFTPVENGVAVLGCYSFFLAPGPILEVNLEEDSMYITSLVAAPVIIYCEKQILEVRRNGTTIPWEYDERRKTLTLEARSHVHDQIAHYHVIFED